VKPAEYQALQGAATMEDIRPHLRGTIKPYDVVAYLTCLPHANQASGHACLSLVSNAHTNLL
jgi:hypothetical protein